MMKHVARARAGPAGNEAGPTIARWKIVRDRVIPRLPLNDAQRQTLVAYVEQNWVDVKDDCFWMRAWCDYKLAWTREALLRLYMTRMTFSVVDRADRFYFF
jgi:hypothetical protein